MRYRLYRLTVSDDWCKYLYRSAPIGEPPVLTTIKHLELHVEGRLDEIDHSVFQCDSFILAGLLVAAIEFKDGIRNTYGGMRCLENAIQYVQDERANYLDSFGVSAYSLPMAMDQMVATRRYFGKVSGNPLVHVIISYDASVTDLEQAAQYATQCAGYFTSRYQVIWCTHEHDTTNGSLHTHIEI